MAQQTFLHEITLRNFKSFGNNITVLPIKNDTLTLVVGKNLDDSVNGQIESNGAGKTTVLEALCYASYGKTIEDIKVDALINNVNNKNLEVSYVIERGDKFWRVLRYRKNKDRGGTGVSIYEGDSIDAVAYDNLANLNDIAEAGTADKQIAEILGVPFEIFSRIIIFSATHAPFLSLKTADQKEIIEELLGMQELTEKAEKLKKELAVEKKELDTLEEVEKEINRQKEKIQTQIDLLISRIDTWETTKNSDIERLAKESKEISGIDFNEQERLLEELTSKQDEIKGSKSTVLMLASNIKEMKSKLSKRDAWEQAHSEEMKTLEDQRTRLNMVEFDFDDQVKLLGVRESLTKVQSQIDTISTALQKEVIQYAKESSAAADKIEHLQDNKCPFCLQQFADVRPKITELEGIINTNYQLEKDAKKKLFTITEQKQTAQNELDIIKSTLKFSTIDQIHTEKSRRSTIEDRYTLMSSQTNPYNEEGLDGLEPLIKDAEDTLLEASQEIQKIENDITVIKAQLQFGSIVELERKRAQLNQIYSKITELKLSSNPHEETLADLQAITVDGSNADKIKALTRSVEHKMFLHKLFTRPDSFIRKSLLAERLTYLNQQMRYYLDALNLPHKVVFTEELDVAISKLGAELDYPRLSAGQKARVNIALAFAFRDVLQSRFGRFNFCILDECLDTGLSNVGIQHAVKMIKKIAADNELSMFVITHRDEIITSFDNIIEIELSNGFSSII